MRILFDGGDQNNVKIGPIYGDLHAANVCIRADDAIVIDFCAHRSAPLVYDAACLEASLFVDGFRTDDKLVIASLVQHLLPLYDCDPDCRIPAHPDCGTIITGIDQRSDKFESMVARWLLVTGNMLLHLL